MILNIKAKPSSSKRELVKTKENEYTAYLKSKPENNKANIELINLLKKELHINIDKIRIVNKSSKNKIIEVRE